MPFHTATKIMNVPRLIIIINNRIPLLSYAYLQWYNDQGILYELVTESWKTVPNHT